MLEIRITMEKNKEWNSETKITATVNNAQDNTGNDFSIMHNVSIKEELDIETINDPLQDVPRQIFSTKNSDPRNDNSNDDEELNCESCSDAKKTIKDCIWFESDPWSESVCRCRLCDLKVTTSNFHEHLLSKIHKRSLNMYSNVDGPSEHSPWFEPDPFNKSMCRCLLCDRKVSAACFYSHTSSKCHQHSLRKEPKYIKIKRETYDNVQQWQVYKKRHAWLEVDPLDSHYAYCKCCKKRLIRGHSEAERLLHETSKKHNNFSKNNNLTFDNDDDSRTDFGYNDTESMSQNSLGTDLSNKSKKRRDYEWMNYRPNHLLPIYCRYCCCRYTKSLDPRKHEQTKQHQKAAAYQEKLNSIHKNTGKPNKKISRKSTSSELDITSAQNLMKEKILHWGKKFSWLKYKHLAPKYGFCQICEIAVYIPTFNIASKHEASLSHIFKLERNARKTHIKLYEWFEQNERNPKIGKCTLCNSKMCTNLQDIHFNSKEHLEKEKLHRSASNFNVRDSKQNSDKSKTKISGSNVVITTESVSDDSVSENNALPGPAPKRSKIAYESAVKIAQRLTKAHLELLQLTRQINKNDAKTKAKTLPTDITITCESSAVPILKDKSVTDQSAVNFTSKTQGTTSLQLPHQSQQQAVHASSPETDILEISGSVETDESLSLFISSINQTVKKLPLDLMAEWKLKVMQIVYSLELRAWRRQQGLSDQCDINANAFVDNDNTLAEISEINTPNQKQAENRRVGNSEFSEQQPQKIHSKDTEFSINSISTNKEICYSDGNEKSRPQVSNSNVSSSISSNFSIRNTSNISSKQCSSESPIEFNNLTNTNISTNLIGATPISETVSSKASAINGLLHGPSKPKIVINGTDYLSTLSPHERMQKHAKLPDAVPVVNVLSNDSSKTSETLINKTRHTSGSIINLRHIQINSQTHSKVIPVNTWTHPPQRRLSLNLMPQQLQHSPTLRGLPQKTTSTRIATNVSMEQQCSTPK